MFQLFCCLRVRKNIFILEYPRVPHAEIFFCQLVTCLSNSPLKRFQMSGFGWARGEGTRRKFPSSEILSHRSLLVTLFLTWQTLLLLFLFISPPTSWPAVPPSFKQGATIYTVRMLTTKKNVPGSITLVEKNEIVIRMDKGAKKKKVLRKFLSA